ncbi:MAG: hypothetical protein ACR2K0_01730 [Acidimicrobiales bacterium]
MVVLAVAAVVGVIAGTYAVSREDPALTASEARSFTQQALNSSGASNVRVAPEAEVRDEKFTPEGGEPIPVWVVPAIVSGQPVELYVAKTGSRAVNLDDALPDGGFVFGEEEFKMLESFRLDLAADRVQESRRTPALIATVLVVVLGVALLLLVLSGRLRGTRPDEAVVADPNGE